MQQVIAILGDDNSDGSIKVESIEDESIDDDLCITYSSREIMACTAYVFDVRSLT